MSNSRSKHSELQAIGVENEDHPIDIPPGLEGIARGYVLKYLNSLPEFQALFSEGSLDELRVIGHKMKGTGTSYGFPHLTALGSAIEQAAKNADIANLQKHLVSLDRHLRYAVHVLGGMAG